MDPCKAQNKSCILGIASLRMGQAVNRTYLPSAAMYGERIWDCGGKKRYGTRRWIDTTDTHRS